MRDILIIIKKELKRFFTDYRLLLAMIVPGIFIYVIYSIMGPIIKSNFTANKDYEYKIYLLDVDDAYKTILEEGYEVLDYKVIFLEPSNINIMQEDIKKETADLIIDFDNATTPLTINLYYNSAKKESQTIYGATMGLLTPLQVNPDAYNFVFNLDSDLASPEQTSSTIIAMLLPFLLMIFLCTGVMSVAPESIAGEKDRGTIATLLVTPLKRTHLAIGKIISLAIISLIGGISSFIGTILSLPNLTGGSGNIGLYYGALDYIYLLFIIISILFLFVGLFAIASAYAKSVKEASAYSTPIMVVAMIIGILSMFTNLPSDNLGIYFIPIFNSVIAMSTILSLEANVLGIIISIVANLFYAICLAYILGRMFNSEKVMFNK